MTDLLDILSFIRANKGRLPNVEVYGAITGYLDRPESLSESVKIDPNCVCVKVDIFAVKLDPYEGVLRANGITNPLNMYFVNGSMACYVDKRYKMPDWYTFRGNLAIGSKQFSPFLTMFNFSKDNSGSWRISGTNLSDVVYSDWNKSYRFLQYLDLSNRSGRVIVPDDVKQLLCCKAEMPKPEIFSSTPNTSLSSSLAYNQNGVQPQYRTKTKRFTIEDRDNVKDFSDNYRGLVDLSRNSNKAREEYIQNLVIKYEKDDKISDRLVYMLTNLRRYFKSKPNPQGSTGRAIVKLYLEKFTTEYNKEYMGTKAGDYVLSIFDEVVACLLDETDYVNADASAWSLIKTALIEKETTYAGLLGVLTGLDVESMRALACLCLKEGISFTKLVNTNPYELLMFSSGLTVADIEKLAHSLGIQLTEDVKRTRNIGLLYSYTNHSDNGSTCYRVKELSSAKIGTRVTNGQHEMILKTGSYLNDNVKSNLVFYVKDSLRSISRSYPSSGWLKDGFDWVLTLSSTELRNAMSDFISSGLGVQFDVDGDNWLTSTRLLDKELFVYSKIYELADRKYDYDHTIIDKLVDKFESLEGYKLEEKQRKAVHLCVYGVAVLTGPAGSGKTTTARCIVYVLQCYEEYKRLKSYNITWESEKKTDDDIIAEIGIDVLAGELVSIQYGCPTGKAAKRLQEVVGSDVKTMHSLFGVGSLEEDIFSGDLDDDDATDSPDIYIFDENAMVTIDLLYNVLKKVNYPRIWFLGDISQLSPIGKGLPFKNLLRFAPCVRLTVSKRSAEGSGITYNSQVVNEFSEPSNWRDLKSTDDFKIVPCQEDEIPNIVALICKFYLNTLAPDEEPILLNKLGIRSTSEMVHIPNLTPDDIQVVTPVGKSTYSWGTVKINSILQPLFNPKTSNSIEFTYKQSSQQFGNRYRVGDRVIHTKNNYKLRWYTTWENGLLQETWDKGITNGDVGKIVGVLPSTECEFLSPLENRPSDWSDDKVRMDSNYKSDDLCFVVVEYYDFNSKKNYYILYHANEVGGYSGLKNNKVFEGTDLGMIQLFYAGTCHKMQGSQNKLIITLLGSVRFKGFITRNMLYTMITRASDGEYMIGSVSSNRNSQLSVSRLEVADDNINTVGELLYPTS